MRKRITILALASFAALWVLGSCRGTYTVSIDGPNGRVVINGVELKYNRKVRLEGEFKSRNLDLDAGSGYIRVQGQNPQAEFKDKITVDLTVYEKEPNDAQVEIQGDTVVSRSKTSSPVFLTDFTVNLPADRELKLDSGSGDITIAGMNSCPRIQAETGSGDIAISAVENVPDLKIETGSGDVTIENIAAIEYLKAETGSGDAALRKAIKIKSGSLKTGSGEIEIAESALEFANLETGSGGIDILESHLGTVTGSTGSGDVTFRKSTFEKREIDTGSGKVRDVQ